MSQNKTTLRQELESENKEKLKVLGKHFDVPSCSTMKKNELVDALLECPGLPKHLHGTWWKRYHNHFYGGITILGLILSVLFYLWAVSPTIRGSVAQYNQYGSLTLNLERRNSLQNQKLNEWLEKTQAFKSRYSSDSIPSELEYQRFILEFTDFAESNFTPAQIRGFRGIESGAGGEMFHRPEELTDEQDGQFTQLALIEYWLLRYIDLNRDSKEPVDPDKLMVQQPIVRKLLGRPSLSDVEVSRALGVGSVEFVGFFQIWKFPTDLTRANHMFSA